MRTATHTDRQIAETAIYRQCSKNHSGNHSLESDGRFLICQGCGATYDKGNLKYYREGERRRDEARRVHDNRDLGLA
jgi:hypothetical protein